MTNHILVSNEKVDSAQNLLHAAHMGNVAVNGGNGAAVRAVLITQSILGLLTLPADMRDPMAIIL